LRSEAESRIYEQLNNKIDELLEMDHFNWMMNDSTGMASDYMKSLVNFLTNILDSFSNLPVSFPLSFFDSPSSHAFCPIFLLNFKNK
jgi:hypothetical protein